MRRAIPFVLPILLATAYGGCGLSDFSGPGDDASTQTWEFRLHDQNDAIFAVATSLMSNGSNSSEAFVRSWRVLDEASFGCSLSIMFQAQFLGSQLKLSTFSKDIPNSTCGAAGVSSPGTGSNGAANGSWPSATRADGMVNLQFTSPAGPSGGVFHWSAIRIK